MRRRSYDRVVARVDVICLPAVEPLHLLGLQLHLLDKIKSGDTAPVLLLFQLSGEIISLGRYHLYDGPASRGGIGAYRRLTGGRIINHGTGWVGCSRPGAVWTRYRRTWSASIPTAAFPANSTTPKPALA
jgi:hypothetical protein